LIRDGAASISAGNKFIRIIGRNLLRRLHSHDREGLRLGDSLDNEAAQTLKSDLHRLAGEIDAFVHARRNTNATDEALRIQVSAAWARGDHDSAVTLSRQYLTLRPKDADAALAYGQALRASGQRAQAAAVLEQATIAHPGNKALLAGYGRALADNGNSQAAFDVLSRAHSPANPDWRILSVQGTTLDKLGKHEEARRYYAGALKIVPDEPSVLSNLGLSYALGKDLTKAEATLRQAVARPGADPRVRQNLALVVGLQGRFAEAESIARSDLPPEEAAANVAYLKQMMSEHTDLKKAEPAAKPENRKLSALARNKAAASINQTWPSP